MAKHMLCKEAVYAAAWFMRRLQEDEAAGQAFFVENAEPEGNALYQDVKVFCEQ